MHAACWALLLSFGAAQALWYRRSLNPDGVAYLDLSDAVLSGQWGALVQGYWSPVYPVLLALARLVFGSGPLHENSIAHGVNLAGYVCALAGWSLLLDQLARRRAGLLALDTPLGIVGGYAVFAWATLWLTSLHFVTPDLWLAGCIFAAAALVLRHQDRVSTHASVMLGAVLGLGYLTKSVLLPVAPFFLLGTFALAPRADRRRVLVRAVSGLGLLAVPWITAISLREGRPTFGDTGRFNYAWFVSGDRWLSPDPERETGPGAAVFPRVVASPAAYAWPTMPGTYAPWRDPSRWHGRMVLHANAEGQWRVLERSWRVLSFWLAPWVILLVVAVAGGARPRGRPLWGALAVLLPAAAATAGYALVLIEGRYVAPFLAIGIIGVAFALHEGSADRRRIMLATALGVALWFWLDPLVPSYSELAAGVFVSAVLLAGSEFQLRLAPVVGAWFIALGGAHTAARAVSDVRRVAAGEAMVDFSGIIRGALIADGWQEGARVAVIGDGPNCALWARSLRARIVAELPASQAAAFWSSPASVQMTIARAMRDAGASEVVADGTLPDVLPSGWRRVPGVQVARYRLDGR